MSSRAFVEKCEKLDARSRHLLHTYTIIGARLTRTNGLSLLNHTGWAQLFGAPITRQELDGLLQGLLRKEFLEYGSYGSAQVVPELEDMIIQDSIRQATFDLLHDACEQWKSGRGGLDHDGMVNLRVAFYSGNVTYVSKVLRGRSLGEVITVLSPFSPDIFEGLDPAMQELYVVDQLPEIINNPHGSKKRLSVLEQWMNQQSIAEHPGLGSVMLDLAIARGDLATIDRMQETVGTGVPELAGCRAFLLGDFSEASTHLRNAFSASGKKSTKSTKNAKNAKNAWSSISHLPAVLYLLLLLKDGSTIAQVEAGSVIRAASQVKSGRYRSLIDLLNASLEFRKSSANAKKFAQLLGRQSPAPLPTLFSRYLRHWLLSELDGAAPQGDLESAAAILERGGFDWFAAEAYALAAATNENVADRKATAGKANSQNATAKLASKAEALHARHGTASLVDFIKVEPVWKQALNAMAQLAEKRPAPTAAPGEDIRTDRLIWEINTEYGGLSLEAFHQQRKGNAWSKGRKIGRHRLYELYKSPEFAFFTDQDRAICQALEMDVSRNYYGYTETSYHFDLLKAARALIGHPCVFKEGKRESPLEIVEQEPKLIVVQGSDDQIELSLDPSPRDAEQSLRIVKEGTHRVAIVFYNEQHRKLHQVLGGKLRVPREAAQQVVESVQQVASLVTVQSEITGEGKRGASVPGDPQPHAHLVPFQSGLRVEFYVRPLGEQGPCFRPGEGGANLMATVEGRPMTARRDLAEEVNRLEEMIAACPSIASRLEFGWTAGFPSPMEALDMLLQLEDQVSQKRVVLHWPQGNGWEVAGRAAESQLRLNIRRDRDWFAASGELKIDSRLTLDLMKLLDLVEATPGRFVRLDDGRFLALTEQLREKVDELAAYGERTKGKNKLRFPPVRAVMLEDLEQSVQLKSDKYWKEWTLRMRQSAELLPEVPSTLQAELRDYQVDGFRWLARLSNWGMGGCLADDMGLGKTLQAIALLLFRASEGPALVVAPTSVVFNWHSELQRFAPSLNVQLYAEGDREAVLRKAGSRDVILCSYGLLQGEAERLQKVNWHTVVLDEAQAIKNAATLRSKAARSLTADFRLILTGTPLENHLGELWNLFEFINPGLLGSLEDFQRRFAIPIERDHCRETRRRLKKMVQPFLLRRTKSQVLPELPPRTEVTLMVTLSDEEAALYEALRQRALERLSEGADNKQTQLQIFAELTRLRRACCHPQLVMDDWKYPGSKLALFTETLEEILANQHKVLVFSQFVDHLTILRDELDRRGVSYQYLDGSTPARQRKQRVEACQGGGGRCVSDQSQGGGAGIESDGGGLCDPHGSLVESGG